MSGMKSLSGRLAPSILTFVVGGGGSMYALSFRYTIVQGSLRRPLVTIQGRISERRQVTIDNRAANAAILHR